MDKIHQICVTKNGGIAKCDTTKPIEKTRKQIVRSFGNKIPKKK